MKKFLLVAILILANNTLYATDGGAEGENFFSTRKMYSLNTDYRKAHQLLVIKDLSGVLEYAGRSILVVKLVDDSEVPFYRSSGKNSGLPKTWLPFFGLAKNGWIHKNYTFNEAENTHIPLNPLYHSGDYILAQAGNELDRLAIPLGNVNLNDSFNHISTFNYWIGGEMLNDSMPKALKASLKTEITPPVKKENIHNIYKVSLNNFSGKGFGSFKDKSYDRQTVVGGSKYIINSLNNLLPDNNFIDEISKAKSFLHDLRTLTQRMEKFADKEDNRYHIDYEAFINLIKESLALYQAFVQNEPSKDSLINAYLALQMLKRFNFNYVHMMLNDITKDSPSFELTEEVSSRAVWITVKQLKKFNDQEKSKLIRDKLTEIRGKNKYCFQTLCIEHPVQIVRFISDRPTVETETERDFENENLLKEIRSIILQIYPTSEKEISNIKRVIQKQYHHKTFAEMVEHYTYPDHMLQSELPGINCQKTVEEVKNKLNETIGIFDEKDENKLKRIHSNIKDVESKLFRMIEIPNILAELKDIKLNSKNYISTLKNLLNLKNISQASNLDSQSKKSFQLCIEQLTTVLYMEALTNISEFK